MARSVAPGGGDVPEGPCRFDPGVFGAQAEVAQPADVEGGERPALAGPGSMGENLFVHGIDENAVCIGDRFRLGSAVIEVSQPRQPCATIERHLGRKGIVKAIVQSGRCGMFFRVIEPGVAQAGDVLEPIEQGATEWTVRRAFHLVYGGGQPDRGELEELASLPRASDRLVHDIRRKHPVT